MSMAITALVGGKKRKKRNVHQGALSTHKWNWAAEFWFRNHLKLDSLLTQLRKKNLLQKIKANPACWERGGGGEKINFQKDVQLLSQMQTLIHEFNSSVAMWAADSESKHVVEDKKLRGANDASSQTDAHKTSQTWAGAELPEVRRGQNAH